jgi:cytochrome oxidase Cu insertion factor (SCO1/SenC/PrrC family)
MRLLILLAAAFLCSSSQLPPPAPAVGVQKSGPQVGQPAPEFTLTDQHGTPRTLKSVLGPNGATIVFFRSADW